MSKNKNLYQARAAKNDEFYTQISDIEREMKNYRKYFENKTIFCNCDDPTSSNFWKFFHLNFNELKLEKLISTHYHESKPTYKLEYGGGCDNDIEAGTKTPLKENGDFRRPESIELLKESDIVVTNPPFSLFREYIDQLFEYDKKFIIIGNMNAVTYKNIFPRIAANEMWLGYLVNKTCYFQIPQDYPKHDEVFTKKMNDGKKYGKVPSITVYTNLDIPKRYEDIILYERYSPEKFPKYDNYDAINIDKVKEIPMDYNGVMGVPVTFLEHYNPSQFEILELANSARYIGKIKCLTIIDGQKKYNRIFIKKK